MLDVQKMNNYVLPKPKLLYFTLALSFYMFHQFKTQFIYDRYGVEKGKLGLYLSVPQAISFFSNIVIGSINDRSGRQKMLLVVLFIIGGIFFDSFFWSKSVVLFWIYYTVYFAFMSATIPLLDKVMMDYVSEIPGMGSKALGSQRLWLTFGYLVTNFTVENIISTEVKSVNNYDAMRPFNVFVTAVSIALIVLFVKNLPRRQVNAAQSNSIVPLLLNFEYMYFIFIIILCGISRAFMTTYLGLYYSKILMIQDQKNDLNLPGFLNFFVEKAYAQKQSTTTVFGVALEILFFYKSGYIIDKLGLYWPIFLSMCLQLVRFICYANLSYTNPNSFKFVCLFELIKGASYSLIHASALQLANFMCPPNLRTTSQLCYNGSFVALGTILSGILFQGFFSPSTDDIEKSYLEFNSAFKWNIGLTVACIGFFLYKYAIRENLLFNRENAKRKIEEYENLSKEQSEENEIRIKEEGNKISAK